MGAPGATPRWRLVLGVIAFAAWAPVGLMGLPCAALLAVVPDRSARPRIAAALLGTTSIALLAFPGGRLSAVIAAYTLILAVAFAAGALLPPAPFFLPGPRPVAGRG